MKYKTRFLLTLSLCVILFLSIISVSFSSPTGEKILEEALKYDGKIKYSQEERHTFDESGDLIISDCSDFVQFITLKITGVEIGNWTGAQVVDEKLDIVGEEGEDGKVPFGERMEQLELGDFIYRIDYEDKSNHVAIYAGDNMIIDCSTNLCRDPSVFYREIPEHWYTEFMYIRRVNFGIDQEEFEIE